MILSFMFIALWGWGKEGPVMEERRLEPGKHDSVGQKHQSVRLGELPLGVSPGKSYGPNDHHTSPSAFGIG